LLGAFVGQSPLRAVVQKSAFVTSLQLWSVNRRSVAAAVAAAAKTVLVIRYTEFTALRIGLLYKNVLDFGPNQLSSISQREQFILHTKSTYSDSQCFLQTLQHEQLTVRSEEWSKHVN
jgi:hypothetical protein